MMKQVIAVIVGCAIYDQLKKYAPTNRWVCPDPACGASGWCNSLELADREALRHREEAHE